ncbi:response regulator transcription factor [Xylophilus sp. GOD-11R]|uniref:response regulator transcription factor n=1 Tax=Xylophilus sp. GOD-11R TaxID=3089814 RepID=UPI00298C760E|nr:response regulator [Xylophilus sp. GOD-11R]WPB58992.1 response regulator [Xylophilus sp. GOD-11R]
MSIQTVFDSASHSARSAATCAAIDQHPPTVFVVDDDESMRSALCGLLRSVGIECRAFASAQAFLQQPDPTGAACLVLDLRLPELSGLDVQRILGDRGRGIPVIFITGHATIAMTVSAMKAGAVEFLTKPFAEADLLGAIQRALDADRASGLHREALAELRARYESLTPRERQVMALVVSGLLNKQAAARLGTSEITVKVHRRQVMSKMCAGSLPDLVRMAERIGSPALS